MVAQGKWRRPGTSPGVLRLCRRAAYPARWQSNEPNGSAGEVCESAGGASPASRTSRPVPHGITAAACATSRRVPAIPARRSSSTRSKSPTGASCIHCDARIAAPIMFTEPVLGPVERRAAAAAGRFDIRTRLRRLPRISRGPSDFSWAQPPSRCTQEEPGLCRASRVHRAVAR